MIFVTQGHEKSISLEVFFKSLLHLKSQELKKIKLFANKDSIAKTLKSLQINFDFKDDFLFFSHKRIEIQFLGNKSQSSEALNQALEYTTKDDILLTLPTSKDQLFYKNKIVSGHTDFFRKKYNKENITMFFSGTCFDLLLITDHIPLKDVRDSISFEIIIAKTTHVLNFKSFDTLIFSGLNPHAGEKGLLGEGEKEIELAIDKLKYDFPNTDFRGPIPGDTIHQNFAKNTLIVSMYHDHGLSLFKQTHLFYGTNITLGLPFIRLSPDHGTAFNLYGKNSANELGCTYTLRKALHYHG